MAIPKNCDECPETDICPSPHYGGDGCEYEQEINSKTIGAFLNGNNHRGNTN